MAIIPGLLVSFITITVVAVLIIQVMRKGVSGIKLMLLGISITLFGGILAVDPKANIGGIEYLITLVGLVFSIIGFGKKD
jgi:hypothetical protein